MKNAKLIWLATAALVPAIGLAALAGAQPPAADSSRDPDVAAIRQSAREFAVAFNKDDAKAVATLFTEAAECREAGIRRGSADPSSKGPRVQSAGLRVSRSSSSP